MLECQRGQKAAADADKKREDATKEEEETARAETAQVSSEEAKVSLSGSTSEVALSVPCLLLCKYVSACHRQSETGVSHFLTSLPISGKVRGRG